jgi:hypothetical protein
MRTSTAYFAGAGTVVAAIAIGLGGGLTIGNIMSPHPDKGIEVSRLERRMSGEPVPAANPAPAPVPYLAATQPEATAPAAAPAPTQAQPRTEAANPAPTPPPAAEQPATTASIAKPQDPPTPPPPAVALPAREQAAKPDDAMAKARDADLKHVDRNRSERRQQWADRRRHEPRQREQLDAQQPAEFEQLVTEDAEPREVPAQPRMEFPLFRLFGPPQ